MSTLLYHPAFAVIPLLRGNSDANNQWNLRHFSAYIIIILIELLNELYPEGKQNKFPFWCNNRSHIDLDQQM